MDIRIRSASNQMLVKERFLGSLSANNQLREHCTRVPCAHCVPKKRNRIQFNQRN